MTRDAEHTPTGYEDAASVVVNQAPAPSSLAGGEVDLHALGFWEMEIGRLADGAKGAEEFSAVEWGDLKRVLTQCLAALSPEAPAREGVAKALYLKLIDTLKPFAEVAEKLKHCHVVEICEPTPDNPSRNIIPMPREWFERAADDLEVIAIQLHSDGVLSEGQTAKLTGLDRVEVRKQVDALTPRHEAPASEGLRIVDEASDTKPAMFEAPAEGAGERERLADAYIAGAMSVHEYWTENPGEAPRGDPEFGEAAGDYAYSTLADLRARSSAPEAREEALGNLLAVIHGDGGHRALEVGTKQAALEAEKIVAGLFAAPSADKLRDHLEWIETVLTDPVPGYTARIATAREYIDQALATMKAEGA